MEKKLCCSDLSLGLRNIHQHNAPDHHERAASTTLASTMAALLALTAPLAMVLSPSSSSRSRHVTMVLPKVSAPPNFVQPTPRPLTVTRPSEELPSLLTGGLVLAIRLATGVFTLGWSPKLLTGDEAAAVGTATGTYGFRFGPLAFRDTSPLLAASPRPEQPLVLYEYEGSPFCRKVREAALLLDVPVEFRPCPGARAGFAAELKERTGRMTVRCTSQARRGDWVYPSPRPSPYPSLSPAPGALHDRPEQRHRDVRE